MLFLFFTECEALDNVWRSVSFNDFDLFCQQLDTTLFVLLLVQVFHKEGALQLESFQGIFSCEVKAFRAFNNSFEIYNVFTTKRYVNKGFIFLIFIFHNSV